MLRGMGFRAEGVRDGEEALSLYREAMRSGDPFRLVILDLTVAGGMGGKATATRLRAFDPGAKIIVSSGYSNDSIMANYAEHGFVAVLAKPYSAQDLDRLLRRLLDG